MIGWLAVLKISFVKVYLRASLATFLVLEVYGFQNVISRILFVDHKENTSDVHGRIQLFLTFLESCIKLFGIVTNLDFAAIKSRLNIKAE